MAGRPTIPSDERRQRQPGAAAFTSLCHLSFALPDFDALRNCTIGRLAQLSEHRGRQRYRPGWRDAKGCPSLRFAPRVAPRRRRGAKVHGVSARTDVPTDEIRPRHIPSGYRDSSIRLHGNRKVCFCPYTVAACGGVVGRAGRKTTDSSAAPTAPGQSPGPCRWPLDAGLCLRRLRVTNGSPESVPKNTRLVIIRINIFRSRRAPPQPELTIAIYNIFRGK